MRDLAGSSTVPTPSDAGRPHDFITSSAFTAVVYAADGVRFVASAHSPNVLTAQIVDYIRGRCDFALWPATAWEVRKLIQEDKLYAAIAVYFSNVGQRWDEERLALRGEKLHAHGAR